jgi:uncharacterized cupredoxin-like copper-binding protein
MKLTIAKRITTALIYASMLALPANAAETTNVNVALLDVSSIVNSSWGMTGMMGRHGWWGDSAPERGSRWSWGRGMMGGWGMMNGGSGMMGMMSIRIDQPTIKSGSVHFNVINWSRATVHEMIIVAVDSVDASLPYDYASGKVSEEQIKSLGEVSELKANATGSLDVTLPAGHYLLICNVPGHYASGMAEALTVNP